METQSLELLVWWERWQIKERKEKRRKSKTDKVPKRIVNMLREKEIKEGEKQEEVYGGRG